MTALRWILFLPVAVILIGIAHSLTGLLSANAPWWIAIPIMIFFAVFLIMTSALPVKIAPVPLIGATILLTLFIPVEGFTLVSSFSLVTKTELIARILTDSYVILGAIIGTQNQTAEA